MKVYVEDGEDAFAWVELEPGDAAIPDDGRIMGRAVDESGGPVPDPSVAIDGEPVVVEDDGSFERTLPHGRYEVAATADSYGEASERVTVRFARTTEVNLQFDADE